MFLMASQEENRHWRLTQYNFGTELFPGFHFRPPGYETSIHVNHGVIAALKRYNPDVVLSGGFSFANFQSALYCKLYNKRYIGWGEVTLRDKSARSSIRKRLRKIMTNISCAAIASTSEAKLAFLSYGAEPDKVKVAIMPIDFKHYFEGTNCFRNSNEAKMLKQKFPGKVILSIGQLIARKGYRELLRAYEKVRMQEPEVSLVILGDGPERSAYEAIIKERKLQNVYFEGFVQLSEVPKYLAIADLFVFHTLFDTFGAVISEAMAAQLIVLSSIHAAATRDLVVDGENGFIFDPVDTDQTALKIIQLLSFNDMERKKIGQAAYASVQKYNFKDTAREMVQFIKSTL